MPPSRQFSRRRATESWRSAPAIAGAGQIDFAAVVRIHQAEIPGFIPLIKIRHAGHRAFQHELGQGIHHSQSGDALGARDKGAKKIRSRVRVRDGADKTIAGLQVALIGLEDRGMAFRLVDGLAKMFAQPGAEKIVRFLRRQGPRTQEDLKKSVEVGGVGGHDTVAWRRVAQGQRLPSQHPAFPFVREFPEGV